MLEGRLEIIDWAEMTLVGHVFWGALFSKIFGFSLTVLRCSTLVLGGLAVIGLYCISRSIGWNKWWSFCAALLLAVNPIFLGLSFTYMTDVPFTCFFIWSTYFFVRAYKSGSWLPLLLASLICVWAMLIRQLALVLPVAWLVASLLQNRKFKSIKAIVPLAVLVACYFVYTQVMSAYELLPETFNRRLTSTTGPLASFSGKSLLNIGGYFLLAFAYLGFLFAPLFPWPKKISAVLKWRSLGIVAVAISITAALVLSNKSIPSLDNIWIDFGIGPSSLADGYGSFKQTPPPNLPTILRAGITFVGVLSACLLFVVTLLRLKRWVVNKSNPGFLSVMGSVGILVYLAPFLVFGLYDRYLLPLIPLLILVLPLRSSLSFTSGKMKLLTAVFISGMGWFSVCATHDYLSWNRVRWSVIEELRSKGVAAHQIDGGAEYVCQTLFDPKKQKWWEDLSPKYVLSFQPTFGEVLGEFNYDRWLPGEGKIYLLKADSNAVKSH